MAFQNRPFADLTEADLRALIDARVEERRDLDYKRDLPGNTPRDRKEYLADLTSFANAVGGHLFFGISEADGVPTELAGLDGINADQEILRLEQIARAGISPRLAGVATRAIPLANGRVVVAMRILKSWSGPHQVSLEEEFRFYGRNSRGKHRLDVAELRGAFGVAQEAADQVRRFRADRVNQILAGETPVPLRGGAKIIFHLVPLGAFAPGAPVVSIEWLEQRRHVLRPVEGWPVNSHVNLDGVVMYEDDRAAPEASGIYAQVYRSGIVEWVNESWLTPRPGTGALLITSDIGRYLGKEVATYLAFYREASIEPPVVFMLTLTGIAGHSFVYQGGSSARNRFDRDILMIPDVAIEDLNADADAAISPAITAFWNAAGFVKPVR
jgi:hypothetical protein